MSLSTVFSQIASGFGATLIVFFCTLLFSMPLGILVALGRMSKFKPLSILIQGIISILRGTPLMLQLIVVFYGPYYVFGLKLSTAWRLYATLIGFSINYAAYFAEIFRAGIQSIPVGQTEAATDIPQDHLPSDGQAHYSAGHQRSHHTGQRYFSGIRARLSGDVHLCQAGFGGYVQPHASLCGGRILLCLQLSSHAHHELH